MGSFFSWIAKNFVTFMVIGLVAGVGFAIWKIDHTTFELKEANRIAKELKAETEGLRLATEAVAKEANAEKERVIRVEREVRYVEAMPTTVTCGDSVHTAVDLMRDRQKGGSGGTPKLQKTYKNPR